MIHIIYMAAGNSRRFGNENKLLQNWKGKPLYLHTFEKLLRIREKEPEKISLTVVTQYPEIYREVQNQPGVNAVFCKESRLGVSYTIKAGIRAVGEIYDSVKKKICPVQEAHDFVRKEHCFVKNESSFERKTETASETEKATETESETAKAEKAAETETKEKTMYVSGDVYMREAADKDAKAMTVLATGKEITVLGEEGDWYQVKVDDKEGYVVKKYITDSKEEAEAAAKAKQDAE